MHNEKWLKFLTSPAPIKEEKGRSRQRGIYRFYCMLSYSVDTGEKQRGLDDILSDLRALPSVMIVTVVVANKRIADRKYIAGIAVKFIPSVGRTFNTPEQIKGKILRSMKLIQNVENIFKVSAGFERIE